MNRVTDHVAYPSASPTGMVQWLEITDDFLILSEIVNNLVLFNASSPAGGPPRTEHEWELLHIGDKKAKSIGGFTFEELKTILGSNPNCCR